MPQGKHVAQRDESPACGTGKGFRCAQGSSESKGKEDKVATGNMQLRLVQTNAVQMTAYSASADPVARIFGEWLDWFGKSAARCRLGPARRQAIAAALQLYDEDMLTQAMVGAAADEWLAQQEGLGVEWILANESRVERFADRGQRIQARAAAAQAMPATPADGQTAPELTDEQRAQMAACRQRMRAIVAQSRGRAADE